jgi:hypothetical protein
MKKEECMLNRKILLFIKTTYFDKMCCLLFTAVLASTAYSNELVFDTLFAYTTDYSATEPAPLVLDTYEDFRLFHYPRYTSGSLQIGSYTVLGGLVDSVLFTTDVVFAFRGSKVAHVCSIELLNGEITVHSTLGEEELAVQDFGFFSIGDAVTIFSTYPGPIYLRDIPIKFIKQTVAVQPFSTHKNSYHFKNSKGADASGYSLKGKAVPVRETNGLYINKHRRPVVIVK